MKKHITKSNIMFLIIGIIIGSIGIVIADTIHSNEVLYDNSNSSSNSENVKDALDHLYNIVDKVGSGYALVANNTTGLSTELIGGLYRYQGVQDASHNVNNYICFGTTNKNDCLSNTDAYMYRIIGINENGQMKLIKKEALNTAYQWSSPSAEWPYSTLYNGINGSYFLDNTTYVPDNTWKERIVVSEWHYYVSNDSTVSTILERELGAPTVNAKIGLLTLSDYAYTTVIPAYSSDSWIILSKNDSSAPNGFDWIMTCYSSIIPWHLSSGSPLGSGTSNAYADALHSIRPVFFLSSSETIASGNGTITDPYILR